jgi:hypothetical protein
LSFWGDQYDYWFGDRHGEAERTLRENQRLVERHLEEQRRLGIISDRRYLEQSVAMRRDINSVLTEMCLISWEQQEQKLETYVAITITMLPVGEVMVGARALGAASVRTGTVATETAAAARNAGAAGRVSADSHASTSAERVAYEVFFEAPVTGSSRAAHRQQANEIFAETLRRDRQVADSFNQALGKEVLRHMEGGRRLLNPPGMVWHHPWDNPGVVQLVRRADHTESALQQLLHPNGMGGYGRFYGP